MGLPSETRRNWRTLRPASGFTLIEVSVILTVLIVLSIVLVPQIRGFFIAAQSVRAKSDLQSIGNAMFNFLRDVGPLALQAEGEPVRMLVSSGDIPGLGAFGDSRWLQPVDGLEVDFFDHYLITNTPGGDPERRFDTPDDAGAGRFAWRGAYLAGPLGTDPWGNRYMMNVQFMTSGSGQDVIVLSAGPNEKVETDFDRDGLFPGGDDLSFLFSPDRSGHGK